MVKIKLSILARLAFSDSPYVHLNRTMATNLVQVPTGPARDEEEEDNETPCLALSSP